jgi:tetratricopeptide (TPR) repeat protein
VVGVAGLAIVVLGAGRAHAADSIEERLIERGVEARKSGDDAEALRLFRQAYELHRGVRAEAQLGLAEQALGRWVDAEAHLTDALASPRDPWIAKNQALLRQSVDRIRQRIGRLEIVGAPTGAEVLVEGHVVGTLPLARPLVVRAGDCRFEVRAPGYVPVTRSVQVGTRELTRESVDLARAPEPAAAEHGWTPELAAAAPAAPPDDASSLMIAKQNEPGAPATGRGNKLCVGCLVVGGAGLAAAAAGLYFGLRARAAGEKNSQPGAMFDQKTYDIGHRDQTLQYVAYGLGGALLAASVTMFVVSGRF